VVFQYVAGIYECGISANAFPMHRVAFTIISKPLAPSNAWMIHRLIVLATVPDHSFASGSGLEPNYCQICSPGFKFTRTVNLSTVEWTAANVSGFDGLSPGCPVGPSVTSYNALDFAV